MQSLFMERTKTEQQLRNARAHRERIAADNIDDPKLEDLRKEIAALEAKLSDISAGEREGARRERQQASKTGREERANALKSFRAELRIQAEAAARFVAAANAAGLALDEHRSSVRRAKHAVGQYATGVRQQDAVGGMILDLPNTDVVGVLARAGLGQFITNPHSGTGGNLSALVDTRSSDALRAAHEVLFPSPTPDEPLEEEDES